MIATTNSNAGGLAVLSSGQQVAAWSDSSGVHAQLFDTAGAPAQTAVPVATSGTFSGVAALPAGGYVVEYQTPQAVFVQRVSSAGSLAGPAAVVRTQDQIAQSAAGDIHLSDPILVGGGGVYGFSDGSYAASYVASVTSVIPGSYPITMGAQKFDANGSPVGSLAGLGSETMAVDDLASAAAPGDRVVAASTLACPCQGSGLMIVEVHDSGMQRLFSAQMGLLGHTDIRPSVAGLANGSYIAVWTVSPMFNGDPYGNQVQGGIFVADPTAPQGGRVISGLLTFPNAAPGARVTALADGGFLLTWDGAAQAFDNGGQAISGVAQIQSGSVAATADGGFVVLAQVGSQLVEQQYKITP